MAQHLGKVIRSLRIKAGISRHALAKLAHLDPAVLTRIEEEERPGVRFATVCRLAEALDVSIDQLASDAGLRKGKRTTAKGASDRPALLAAAHRVRSRLKQALKSLDEIAPE